MNIEEGIEILKNSKKLYLKEKVDSDILEQAIETLLTAYEKEKEKEERCDFLDKELYNANQEIQKLQINIQKEKEKNKKAIDFINDKNNYFEDGENWQNILKIKEILEE